MLHSDSQDSEKRRRQLIVHLAGHGHPPYYSAFYDNHKDAVVFTNRGTLKPPTLLENYSRSGRLDPEAFAQAREAAPGWDVYQFEQEWRTLLVERNIILHRPEANLLKFCRTWFEKRGELLS